LIPIGSVTSEWPLSTHYRHCIGADDGSMEVSKWYCVGFIPVCLSERNLEFHRTYPASSSRKFLIGVIKSSGTPRSTSRNYGPSSRHHLNVPTKVGSPATALPTRTDAASLSCGASSAPATSAPYVPRVSRLSTVELCHGPPRARRTPRLFSAVARLRSPVPRLYLPHTGGPFATKASAALSLAAIP
jgi:hypothetical protein